MFASAIFLAQSTRLTGEYWERTSALPYPGETDRMRPLITIPPSLRALRDRKRAETERRNANATQAE
jgi:hypothetical protein